MSGSGYIQSNNIAMSLTNSVTATTATFNLSPADSGKIIFINPPQVAAGTALLAVNLPPPASAIGVRYKFIVGPVGTCVTSNTITLSTLAATACLHSVVSGNITASSGGSTAARTTLTIAVITGGGTGANIGDTIDAFCDGTFWYLACQCNLVAAFTIA